MNKQTLQNQIVLIGIVILTFFVSSFEFFNSERSFMFAILLLIIYILFQEVSNVRKNPDSIFLRTIPGLKAVEEAVGRSTEMGRPILYVPGIMDMNEVETVAGVIILGHVANMTAQYETSLDVPVSRSIVMQAAREACKESYLRQGRPELFNDDMVHYVTDEQFAYAAGVNGIMQRSKPAACMYMGKFYAESLLFAETGNGIGAIQIAGTASQAQIPFFVTACDYTLMGEEYFAASAYLSEKPELIGGVKAQDTFKIFLIFLIGLGFVARMLFDLDLLSFNLVDLIG